MKWKYTCPHCKAVLNPNVKIVLSARRGKTRGLILLSPRPGTYKIISDSDFNDKVKEGELVMLTCPACSADLTSSASRNLAEINLHQPGRPALKIQFSRVQGEQATFVLNGESVVPYGEDAEIYDEVNFFGM